MVFIVIIICVQFACDEMTCRFIYFGFLKIKGSLNIVLHSFFFLNNQDGFGEGFMMEVLASAGAENNSI